MGGDVVILYKARLSQICQIVEESMNIEGLVLNGADFIQK